MNQVMEEHSPPFDSQANGMVESAVKAVRGMVKTLQRDTESRIGQRIQPSHLLMTWLVPHAARLITYRVRGEDHKTAYSRVRGRPWSGRLLCFAEKCRFKIRSKEDVGKHSSGDRFRKGIFLGFNRVNGQYIVYDGNQICEARTVMRLPQSMKWDKEAMQAVAVTPHQLHQPKEPTVTFAQKPEAGDEPRVQQQMNTARRVYIRAIDLENFGFTS